MDKWISWLEQSRKPIQKTNPSSIRRMELYPRKRKGRWYTPLMMYRYFLLLMGDKVMAKIRRMERYNSLHRTFWGRNVSTNIQKNDTISRDSRNPSEHISTTCRSIHETWFTIYGNTCIGDTRWILTRRTPYYYKYGFLTYRTYVCTPDRSENVYWSWSESCFYSRNWNHLILISFFFYDTL